MRQKVLKCKRIIAASLLVAILTTNKYFISSDPYYEYIN